MKEHISIKGKMNGKNGARKEIIKKLGMTNRNNFEEDTMSQDKRVSVIFKKY